MKADLLTVLLCGVAAAASGAGDRSTKGFTETFDIAKADLASTGRNPYFVLEAG